MHAQRHVHDVLCARAPSNQMLAGVQHVIITSRYTLLKTTFDFVHFAFRVWFAGDHARTTNGRRCVIWEGSTVLQSLDIATYKMLTLNKGTRSAKTQESPCTTGGLFKLGQMCTVSDIFRANLMYTTHDCHDTKIKLKI